MTPTAFTIGTPTSIHNIIAATWAIVDGQVITIPTHVRMN